MTAGAGGSAAGTGGSAALSPPTFHPQAVYPDPLHTNLQAIAAGDVNGDGQVDLVASADGGGGVVFLNQGGGVFADPEGYQVESKPAVSGAVALADLDGDGHLDLALASWMPTQGAGDVSVLRNNGDGTFAPSVEFGSDHATSYKSVLVAADLTGDKKPDLVVGGGGVLLNAGSGSFVQGVACESISPDGLAAGDLDGNGAIDLALSNGKALLIFLNTGSGTCGVPVAYPTAGVVSWVAMADLDGDGRRDLVTFSNSPNEIDVWLNQGEGTLGKPIVYPLPAWPWSASVGDLNADGSPDVAIANYDATSGVTVWLNDGRGALSLAGAFAVGAYPQSVAIADLNGDGRQDLAVANHDSHSVSVLLSALP
jgi:hypothetical protein